MTVMYLTAAEVSKQSIQKA